MLQITPQTRGSYLFQPGNRTGREAQDSSAIAYIITDDEELSAQVSCVAEANGIRAKWIQSLFEYLVYDHPDVPSCLLVGCSQRADVQRLPAHTSRPPVIVLSSDVDIPSCVHAMKEGAHDFLTLPLTASHLLNALKSAFEKDRVTLAMRREDEDLRNGWRSLTSREAEVMCYVVGGLLNKQTAAALGIAENTVQVHRGRIMRKMKADSFAALVRMALKLADWGEHSLSHASVDESAAASAA